MSIVIEVIDGNNLESTVIETFKKYQHSTIVLRGVTDELILDFLNFVRDPDFIKKAHGHTMTFYIFNGTQVLTLKNIEARIRNNTNSLKELTLKWYGSYATVFFYKKNSEAGPLVIGTSAY